MEAHHACTSEPHPPTQAVSLSWSWDFYLLHCTYFSKWFQVLQAKRSFISWSPKTWPRCSCFKQVRQLCMYRNGTITNTFARWESKVQKSRAYHHVSNTHIHIHMPYMHKVFLERFLWNSWHDVSGKGLVWQWVEAEETYFSLAFVPCVYITYSDNNLKENAKQ